VARLAYFLAPKTLISLYAINQNEVILSCRRGIGLSRPLQGILGFVAILSCSIATQLTCRGNYACPATRGSFVSRIERLVSHAGHRIVWEPTAADLLGHGAVARLSERFDVDSVRPHVAVWWMILTAVGHLARRRHDRPIPKDVEKRMRMV